MLTVLRAVVDKCFHVFAADLAQASDLHARNLPRPEQGIGGRSADAKFLGKFVRAQKFLGFLGLWMWDHQRSSSSLAAATLRSRGRVPVRLGLFRSVRSRLYAWCRGQLPRRMPGPYGPIYSRCVLDDTQRFSKHKCLNLEPAPLPLSPRQLQPLGAALGQQGAELQPVQFSYLRAEGQTSLSTQPGQSGWRALQTRRP